jgi:hypothetical protein
MGRQGYRADMFKTIVRTPVGDKIFHHRRELGMLMVTGMILVIADSGESGDAGFSGFDCGHGGFRWLKVFKIQNSEFRNRNSVF